MDMDRRRWSIKYLLFLLCLTSLGSILFDFHLSQQLEKDGNEASSDLHERFKRISNQIDDGKTIFDVVYLYVNGSDEELQASLQNLFHSSSPYPSPLGSNTSSTASSSSSLFQSRWRDNDELRYSLRSLEHFLPWFRRLFLVVASPSQIPKWIRQNHPQLQIVYHHQIISCPSPAPSTSSSRSQSKRSSCDPLPTFNSRVIEAHLWKIPGLSSNFIYFNDDFFLLRPVTPADFLQKLPSSSLTPPTNLSSSSSSSSSILSFVAHSFSSTIASSSTSSAFSASSTSSSSSLPSTSHSFFPPFSDSQYLIYLDTAILPPSGNREALYKYEHNIFKGAMIKTNILLDLHFRRERSSKGLSSTQEGEGEVEQNRFYFRHSPRMISRFLFQELFQEFTSEFQELKSPMHRQRSPKDIHPLFLYYHFMLKKHSDSFHLLSNFESGLRCKYVPFNNDVVNLILRLAEAIFLPTFKFLCINDDFNREPPSRLALFVLRLFYSTFFPIPSSFEVDSPWDCC